MNENRIAMAGVLFCVAAGLVVITGAILVIAGTWARKRGTTARQASTGRLLRRVIVAVALLSAASATAGLLWR